MRTNDLSRQRKGGGPTTIDFTLEPAGEVSRMCRYAKLRFFSEVTHV